MLSVPERLKGISHPLIASMYLKHEALNGDVEDVLVIETNYHNEEKDYSDFDSYVMELLTDLSDLRSQAEQKVGKFDRIDIRS